MLREFFKNILNVFSFLSLRPPSAYPRQREAKINSRFCGRFVNRPYKNFCDACSFAKIILLSYKNENDKGKTALVIMLISIKVLSLFYLHNAITS